MAPSAQDRVIMNHLRTIEKGGSIILEDTNESHYLENSVEQRRYSSRLQNYDYQTGKTTLRNYDSAKSYHLSAVPIADATTLR